MLSTRTLFLSLHHYTEVGLLSHNVRIVGAAPPGVSSNSPVAKGWGCHVRVSSLAVGSALFKGTAELDSVEIDGCGQDGTLRHALHFENAAGKAKPSNKITLVKYTKELT